MLFSETLPITAGEIGTWLLCLFVVLQGANSIKTLFFSKSKKNELNREDYSYKEQIVTREELNGKLEKIEKNQYNLADQMTDIAKDVAVLKAKVKPYWEE